MATQVNIEGKLANIVSDQNQNGIEKKQQSVTVALEFLTRCQFNPKGFKGPLHS